MKVYAQIKKGKYIDSLETLFSSSVLNEQPGVDVGYVCMATASFKDILAEIGISILPFIMILLALLYSTCAKFAR